ncbi:DUF2220 family protein [Neolewinella lacunae]|uniref:Wadjet protein JetD C-terminal domain-containing protein n=1 Tax=Neolewinella lacunae TaxID=1517758 RepID=A0A923T9U0_9BACT|nr:Wadjet anti-phage system protein JetD domain-containing protein [Neolewinella lacunae]MBC6995891.1 hypothetical protein [Neolewinella lacunae]MDN3636417.1 DUF2220 family protein [Neolewinella lacunae]
MPNEVELRFFERLEKEGFLARSQVPGTVRKSNAYAALVSATILREEGRGGGYIVRVVDAAALGQYLDSRYPGRHQLHQADAAGNLHRYRDSKAGKRPSAGLVLLRGEGSVQLNGQTLDLGSFTRQFGCFACQKPDLAASRICTVENLDSFLNAEAVLGAGWVFVHPYGRLGKTTFNGLNCEELLHFGDYDYTGLDEYLRLHASFPRAQLYLPADLASTWQRFSRPLKAGATASARVQHSDDAGVSFIRQLLATTNRFLEQQALFIPQVPPP